MKTKYLLSLFVLIALLFATGGASARPLTAALASAPVSANANASGLPVDLQLAFLDASSKPFARQGANYTTKSRGLVWQLNAAGLQADATGFAWDITLSGFGREGNIASVAAPQIVQEGARLDYRRGAVTEWYRDTALGLQQGFTIHEAPGGRGLLVLQLDLSTDLAGALDADGRGLSFPTGDGRALRYDHLLAFDARGAELEARLALQPGRILIQVNDRGAAYPLTIDPLIYSLEQKVPASDGAAFDEFGYSVALSGDTALVGAERHDVGVNANQGSAYVFTRSGTTWTQQQQIAASDGAAYDLFAISVALSGDMALVGAALDNVGANANQGSAYVFTRNGTTWTEQQKLTASDGAGDDQFGVSVALSGDTALVGAYYDDVGANADQGSAYFYTRNTAPVYNLFLPLILR